MRHEQGVCAKCGSFEVDYETIVDTGSDIYYPYRCCECGSCGKEYYSLEYLETVGE